MSFHEQLQKQRGRRIHDIVPQQVEEKAPIFFDPKKEIDELGWEAIDEELEYRASKVIETEGNESSYLIHLAELMEAIAILRPTVELSETMKQVKELWKSAVMIDLEDRNNDWTYTTLFLARAGVLYFGSDILQYPLDTESAALDGKFVEIYAWQVRVDFFSNVLFLISDSVVRERIRSHGPELLKLALSDFGKNKEDGQYITAIKNLKILDPKGFAPLQQKLDWDSLHRLLQQKRVFPGEFAVLASEMKILAAEDVQVVDHQLKITMPKQDAHKEKIPPRPIRSTFENQK